MLTGWARDTVADEIDFSHPFFCSQEELVGGSFYRFVGASALRGRRRRTKAAASCFCGSSPTERSVRSWPPIMVTSQSYYGMKSIAVGAAGLHA